MSGAVHTVRKPASEIERYGPETCCMHCGRTMSDWVEVAGVKWTVKLSRKGVKWICQFCKNLKS